ncbi:MAG: acyl-ACP--UDP-N-acetylglucosamine O-acyltransferase [Betaproteobacteria bacterium]|nr:acyl-ACP--UDP-N-acetylglucosamine O-acyltransferase [Betaproteobacteria bacterium]
MIHPTALVHSGAKLAQDVEIGPYAVIGEHVEIGSGTSIGSHTVVSGHTRIGKNNRIFHHNVLGEGPQDKKYAGEPTRLEIGDGNMIREFCTFNTGTVQDVGVTRLGDDNWVMAYVHLAHDSQVGSHTILANMVTLAGHVAIHDHVILGGGTMVHQFCRVGAHAFTAGGSIVLRDVPPFVMASGNSAEPHGVNVEGLKRRGFDIEAIEAIRRAYKTLYKSGLALDEAKAALRGQAADYKELEMFVEFLDSSTRSIIR